MGDDRKHEIPLGYNRFENVTGLYTFKGSEVKVVVNAREYGKHRMEIGK